MKLKYSALIVLFVLIFEAFIPLKKYYVYGYIRKTDKVTPITGAVIELHTQQNGKGEKKINIISNESGFFKSDKAIDFTQGLYPSVKYGNKTVYMNFSVKTGNCMICHSTNKIIIK